jgi:hypothetical protein
MNHSKLTVASFSYVQVYRQLVDLQSSRTSYEKN